MRFLAHAPRQADRRRLGSAGAEPAGLTLIAAVSEKPNLMGTTYGALPGFPPSTVRLILVWGAGALPTAITLS